MKSEVEYNNLSSYFGQLEAAEGPPLACFFPNIPWGNSEFYMKVCGPPNA